MDFEQVLALRQTAPLATGDGKPTHLTLVKDPVLFTWKKYGSAISSPEGLPENFCCRALMSINIRIGSRNLEPSD